ncbi:MAG TPA: zinc ribbon domain-containing protein [Ktedonobacterales bacterium]|nr:zinc ribbon domain-containing protein [Ktedonobacterales bacterium]
MPEHRHKGVVPWSKSFFAMLLTNHYPREFAPGSGHGTILTPDGERIEGKHVAAWSWDPWHHMDEARALNKLGTRGRARTAGVVRMFSGLAVCAACGRALHHQLRHRSISGYYSTYLCAAAEDGYVCSVRTMTQPKTGKRGTRGWRCVRSSALEEQFAALVLDWELPSDWREQIAAEVNRMHDDGTLQQAAQWRANLQVERKRILLQHRTGRISDEEMLEETARIDGLLATLPTVESWEVERETRITAADTLAHQRDYWDHATPEQRAEALRLIMEPYGIAVDLERLAIMRIKPRPALFPTFRVPLTHHWREHEGGWFSRV